MARSLMARAESGPAASATWAVVPTSSSGTQYQSIPDAANQDRIVGGEPALQYVAGGPTLARGAESASPLFSLTLTLERQPRPGEASIAPLVTGGTCGMTLTILPLPGDLASLGSPTTEYRALFPRRSVFRVGRDGDPKPLADATVEGSAGRGGLTLNVDRNGALSLLGALRGEDTGLYVDCDVTYRAVGPALPPLRITVDLAIVHDFLSARAAADRVFFEVDLRNYLAAMLESGLVRIEGPSGPTAHDANVLAGPLLSDFLRAATPILGRMGGEASGDLGRPFVLRGRPSDGATVTFSRVAGPAASEEATRFSRRLVDVLRGVPSQPGGADAFVHAVCLTNGGTGYEPIVRRLPATRAAASPRAEGSGLASLGSTAATLPAVLRTGQVLPAPAHALVASDLVLHADAVWRPTKWALDDLVLQRLDLAVARPQSLPVIEGQSSLWPDRINTGRYWYAPDLVVVEPAATATTATSPFLFSFVAAGHDAQGRPGLEATIRVTLRRQMSPEAQQEWKAKGSPPSQSVPLNGLAVSVEVPFRDGGGETRAEAVLARSVDVQGDTVVVTFRLTDQWARLAYGALAIDGYQRRPAAIVTNYVFPAYVPVSAAEMRINWGGKRALTPVSADGDGPASGGAVPGQRATALAHSAALTPVAAAHPATTVAVHPHLTPAATFVAAPTKTYGIRTQGRTGRRDVFVPCNRFGSLYVQRTDEERAIGCRDALMLGQVELPLYERMEIALSTANPGCSVYRSLQVPGRFLVVPAAYTIARFEPGDSRAYRPAIFLFSSIDAVHPERSSCVAMATLQPGIPPFRRRELLEVLRAHHHPNPTLEWVTELAVAPEYDWALVEAATSGSGVQPAGAKTPDGFQVSLATGLNGVRQLAAILEHGGVRAGVNFPLSDGTKLSTTLIIDLSRIDGPWDAGPLEVARAAGNLTLTNRIDQQLDVSDVTLYSASAPAAQVAVERRLEAGATISVPIDHPVDEAVPKYSVVPSTATLPEVRSFIEDIYTNVIFMSRVDLTAHKAARLTIDARIVGVEGTRAVELTTAAPVGELNFVLPLTTYLEHPTVQFKASAVGTDGAITSGPWQDWRLDTLGNVIEVQWTQIQGG